MAGGGLAQTDPFARATNTSQLDERVKKNQEIKVYRA